MKDHAEPGDPARPAEDHRRPEDPRPVAAGPDLVLVPARPSRAMTPGAVVRLQAGAGNAAVSRLLARGPRGRTGGPAAVQRVPAAPPRVPPGEGPVSTAAAAPVLGATPADGPRTAAADPSAGPSGAAGRSAPPPSASPSAPDPATAPPAGLAPASGDLGAVTALGDLIHATPSTLAHHVSSALGLVSTALAGEQAVSSLPAVAAPTGLPSGTIAAPPAAPSIGDAAAVSAPPQGGDRPPDPGVADQWAAGGTAAVHRAAEQGDAPAPKPGNSLHPTVDPVALPAVGLPAGGPVGATPGGPAPGDAQEAAALDAAAGAQTRQLVGRLLAPAATAGAAHRTEAAQARTVARTGIADVGTDAAARQQAVRAAADEEVLAEHGRWATQRASIVQEHAGEIRSVAGATRSDIAQTVAQADAQAAARQGEDGGGSGGGLWDRVKHGATAAVGAVKGAVAAVGSTVAGIITAARSRVSALVTRLADAVRRRVSAAVAALRAGAARVWGAIRAGVARAQQAITRLAHAAVDAARRLWAAAAARLRASWDRLVAAARAAFSAAVGVCRQIGAALGKVKEILKLLDSPLLKFLAEASRDVQKKIVDPLLAKAAPYVGRVPGMAKDLLRQQEAAPAAQPVVPLQRQPTSTAAKAVDFSATVDRQMSADAGYFKDNWLATLSHVLWQLVWPTGIFTDEFPALWEEIKGVWSPAPGLDRLDHILGVARRLTNIINGVLATVGIWAALITMAFPPAELITLGTYYAVSVVMIEVDLSLALAQLLKYWYSGTRPGTAAESVTQYARMYSATGIGAIVTALLVVLGMAAARFANRLKAVLPKRPVEPVERPVVPPEEKASVPPEKKPTGPDERGPADETVSLAAWRGKLQLLQGRIAALRRQFTASGSTDQAMNAEITRLETAAQDMATRLDGAKDAKDLTGFGRDLRTLEGSVRDAERRLEGLDVRPPSAVQQELAQRLGMDARTVAGYLDDAQCQRILNLINNRNIAGTRLAGLRNFVQEYAGRGREAGKLMELLDTDWEQLRPALDERASVAWEPAWRGQPRIEDGNAREGWRHIDERHVTGNAPGGPGDLFAPGTTRAEVQAAAEQVVARGTRISQPGLRFQTFELQLTVHGRTDRISVTVDASDGHVITAFPVRGG